MSRYRPPAPSRSPYITAEGRDKLMQELRYISQTLRHDVVKALVEVFHSYVNELA